MSLTLSFTHKFWVAWSDERQAFIAGVEEDPSINVEGPTALLALCEAQTVLGRVPEVEPTAEITEKGMDKFRSTVTDDGTDDDPEPDPGDGDL